MSQEGRALLSRDSQRNALNGYSTTSLCEYSERRPALPETAGKKKEEPLLLLLCLKNTIAAISHRLFQRLRGHLQSVSCYFQCRCRDCKRRRQLQQDFNMSKR